MQMQLSVTLPFPPSVNSAYRNVRGRMVKSKPFRDYVKGVSKCLTGLGFGNKPLAMEILVYPPDNRRRDLDNLGKVLCDSLQAAGFYKDDSQIDDLHFKRMNVKKPGCVVVEMKLICREN